MNNYPLNHKNSKLPSCVGIGLKPEHYQQVLEDNAQIGFLEIHPENYMVPGGLPHLYLEKIRQDNEISMHGVGMSLGSAQGISDKHLEALNALGKKYQPILISEHLSWSHGREFFSNDLLPLPYTEESLETVCRNIGKVQEKLQRTILIENPSTYIEFPEEDYSEQDFFSELVKRTDCKLLLDVNNVFVSNTNHNRDPLSYFDTYPLHAVEEIHLAGHSIYPLIENRTVRVDDHGSAVSDDVWQLLDQVLEKTQKTPPLLIEWDSNVPEFSVLIAELEKAQKRLIINAENTSGAA